MCLTNRRAALSALQSTGAAMNVVYLLYRTRFTYSLNEFHHNFVESDMKVAEASGSGCCDDNDEEPQPNKFTQLE